MCESVNTFCQRGRWSESSSVCPRTPQPWQSCCPGPAPCPRPPPPAAGTWGSLPGWRRTVDPRLWSPGRFYWSTESETEQRGRVKVSGEGCDVTKLWRGGGCCWGFKAGWDGNSFLTSGVQIILQQLRMCNKFLPSPSPLTSCAKFITTKQSGNVACEFYTLLKTGSKELTWTNLFQMNSSSCSPYFAYFIPPQYLK